MKVTRKIIEIDEERCNGCGQCILDCAEHALIIENGKAKVISDHLCDGLGACLQGCPQDALRIIEREASPFDEAAVHALQQEHAKGKQQSLISAHHPCTPAKSICKSAQSNTQIDGVQWPLKLRLIQADSKFSQDEFCLVADCAPPTYSDFTTFSKTKAIFLACPKFEAQDELINKLASLLILNQPKVLTTLRMEVPCCNGIAHMAEKAFKIYQESTNDGRCTIKHLVLKRNGEFKEGI